MIDLTVLESNSSILEFLFEKDLIKKNENCLQCNLQMIIVKYKCIDSYTWRCPNYHCSKKVSIRTGSIFEKSHLKLKEILSILNFCGVGISPRHCSKMLKIRATTVQEWYQCFRQSVSTIFKILKQEKIGGQGEIIEIDD